MRVFKKIRNVVSKVYGRLFTKKLRRQVRNHNFTIFCNTCIGGYIYHRLQSEFLSPTINMWFDSNDMIKFLLDPLKYLSLELSLLKFENGHPVCALGDLLFHFNHSDTFESAKNDWNRRRERVNLNNCYAIIVDMENKIEPNDKRIRKISLIYRNTVILNRKYNEGLFKKIIVKHEDEWHYNLFGMHDWEIQWDFAKFLNNR